MRLCKGPRIRLDSAKAVPQVFFQASGAAFILFILTVSTNIVENSFQGNRIGHHVQDGGPLPSSLMTQMQSKSPAVTMPCSAGGGKGVEGPQDLNYTTCRYYLDTESALRDTLMSSRLQGFSFICNLRSVCLIIRTVSAMNCMLKLARFLCVLRFVYPSVFHGAGLVSVFTFLSWIQFCARVGENHSAFPIIANTIITYCSIVVLGIPAMCWGILGIVKILLCAAMQTVFELRKLRLCLLRNPYFNHRRKVVSWNGWFDEKHRSEKAEAKRARPSRKSRRSAGARHEAAAAVDPNQKLRRRLTNCTTRLLQVAWQKHKAVCSLGSKVSKKHPFWTIYEAELVLSIWNAKRLNGFDAKFQEGQRGDISFEEFLARVEAIAHPGKSTQLKKQRSDAKRSSIAPGPSPPVFLWQVALVLIALAILVLLPVLFLAGGPIEFPLLDSVSRVFVLVFYVLAVACSGLCAGLAKDGGISTQDQLFTNNDPGAATSAPPPPPAPAAAAAADPDVAAEGYPSCAAEGAEQLLFQWATARGLIMPRFDMGKASATELVSLLQAANFSALPLLDPNRVPAPPAADAGTDEENQAFREGFYRTLELAVLAATSSKPKARFLHLPARANGFCLFDAVSTTVGGSAEEWREKVVKALCSEWDEACSAGLGLAGHGGRTVGEALASEHGEAFSGPEEYAEHMRKRNGKGEVPQGTSVEAERLASLVHRAVWILTREPDGGVSHSMLFLPTDGVISGDTVFLLHGMRGTGGEHFDTLLAEDSPEEDAEEPDALHMSEWAWQSARRLAMGACLARLCSVDALNLAVAALGGGWELLLEALREAVMEAGVLQADLPGCPGPDDLRAAARRLADGATEAEQLARLLRCTALLRSAMADLLVQEAKLTRGVLAEAHEAGSEDTRTIMKEKAEAKRARPSRKSRCSAGARGKAAAAVVRAIRAVAEDSSGLPALPLPHGTEASAEESKKLLHGSSAGSADAGFAAAAGGCRGLIGGGGALGSGNIAADMVQVTVKCDKRVAVFDGVSRDVQCSALLSMLEVRLGVKIPGNARLIGNGRFIGMGESIQEAGLIGTCILEVQFVLSGGMKCFFSCLRPNVESEPDSDHQNSRMRAQEVMITSMGREPNQGSQQQQQQQQPQPQQQPRLPHPSAATAGAIPLSLLPSPSPPLPSPATAATLPSSLPLPSLPAAAAGQRSAAAAAPTAGQRPAAAPAARAAPAPPPPQQQQQPRLPHPSAATAGAIPSSPLPSPLLPLPSPATAATLLPSPPLPSLPAAAAGQRSAAAAPTAGQRPAAGRRPAAALLPRPQQEQQQPYLPFPRPSPNHTPSSNSTSQDWSIPAENLVPLLDALATDFFGWKGSSWDGYSESLRGYFMENKIDPKVKYARFYVPQRHTVAVSYTWRGTTLRRIAEKASEPSNNGERYWIDVLNVDQNSISTSDQVILTTDFIYSRSKIEVFLDNSYLSRAWCLAEAGQYTNPTNKCNISVSGSAELKPGTDFFNCMDAGHKTDIPLIQKYILGKYGSAANFNAEIDNAILRLSPWSLMHQGRYNEALNACQKEIKILEQDCSASDTMAMADAYGNLALAHDYLGNYDGSLGFHQKSLDIKIKCKGSSHVAVAATEKNIGVVLFQKGEYENALVRYQKALKIEEQCLGLGHVDVASTYCNMGIVYRKLGNFEKALEMYEKDLEITKNALGEHHADVAATELNIGTVLARQGDLESALVRFQKALRIQEVALGPSHVDVARTYGNMGLVYCSLGNFEKALEMHEKDLEIKLKTVGGSHVDVAKSEEGIGIVLAEKGDHENALLRFQKALKIKEQCLGTAHAAVASTHVNIGNVYRQQGDNEKALFHLNTALPVLISQLGSSHVDVAKTQNNIAIVLEQQGKFDEALRMYEASLKIKREALGEGHVDVARTQYNIGMVYRQLGNLAQARSLMEAAHNIYLRSLGPDHPKTKQAARDLEQLQPGISPYIHFCGPAPYGGPAGALPYGRPAVAPPYGGPGPAMAPPYGGPAVASPYGGPGAAMVAPYGGPAVASPYGGPAVAPPYGGPGPAVPAPGPYGGQTVAPPYGRQNVAPPYGGQAVAAPYGAGQSMQAVELGQDAAGLPGVAGLTHADFRAGEPVAVLRTSGRRTVGRVTAAWPGWVRVEVEQGGASKDVPEGDVCRLLGGLRLS